MDNLKLYMLLLGATVPGRYTEQHDIFFSIGGTPGELVPAIKDFWPQPAKVHIDAWREVNFVDGYHIEVVSRQDVGNNAPHRLFFINLGGYKKNEFDEFHYKMLAVAEEKGKAIQAAKQTAFYKHIGFEGAGSHVDDKYGVDVDDIYAIEDILPAYIKERYSLKVLPAETEKFDTMNLGYFKLDKI
jgi:hypothetical protein